MVEQKHPGELLLRDFVPFQGYFEYRIRNEEHRSLNIILGWPDTYASGVAARRIVLGAYNLAVLASGVIITAAGLDKILK